MHLSSVLHLRLASCAQKPFLLPAPLRHYLPSTLLTEAKAGMTLKYPANISIPQNSVLSNSHCHQTPDKFLWHQLTLHQFLGLLQHGITIVPSCSHSIPAVPFLPVTAGSGQPCVASQCCYTRRWEAPSPALGRTGTAPAAWMPTATPQSCSMPSVQQQPCSHSALLRTLL